MRLILALFALVSLALSAAPALASGPGSLDDSEPSKFVVTGELRAQFPADSTTTYPDGSHLIRRSVELKIKTGGVKVRPACFFEECTGAMACAAALWTEPEDEQVTAACFALQPGQQVRVQGYWIQGVMRVFAVGPH